MWKTLTGRAIVDVVDFVRDHARDGQVVHLGTDSLQLARHTRFVTVVAILTPGRGGRAIWTRAVSPRIASLRERLLREVWLSVELGLRLDPVVPGAAARPHQTRTRSRGTRAARMVQELGVVVVDQGFRAVDQARELGREPRRGSSRRVA